MRGILIGGPDGPRDVSSEEVAKLLGLEPDGFLKEVGKMIGLEDCGDANCPFHAKPEPEEDGKFSAEQAMGIDAEQAAEYMVAAVAGAHNAIADGKWRKAETLQEQADLWHRVWDMKVQQESITLLRAQEAQYDMPAPPEDTRTDAERMQEAEAFRDGQPLDPRDTQPGY